MKKVMILLKILTIIAWFVWGAFVAYFDEYNVFKLVSFLFLIACSVFLYLTSSVKHTETNYEYRVEKFYWALKTIIILFIFCLLHLINSKIVSSVDLTHQKLYKLKRNSSEQVKNLTQSGILKMKFWGTKDHWNLYEDLLLFYKNISNRVELQWIDPNINPEKANEISGRKLPLLSLEFGEQLQWVDPIDEWTIGMSLTGFQKKSQKIICFFQSHQAHEIDSKEAEGYLEFKQFLQGNGYKIQHADFRPAAGVAHCDLLIIAGIKDDFLEDEIKLLTHYAKSKPMIIAIDPWGKDFYLKKFRNWMESFGISSIGTPILDQSVVQLGEEAINVLWENSPEERIGPWQNISEIQGRSIWQLTTGLSFKESNKISLLHFPLIVSKKFPTSWQEKNWNEFSSGKVNFEKGVDIEGPITMAMHVKGIEKDNKINMIVLGTSRVWMNGFASFSANFHLGKVFIEGLLGESKTSAPVITLVEEKILLHQGQANLILYFSIFIVPSLLLLFAYWVFRKNNLG